MKTNTISVISVRIRSVFIPTPTHLHLPHPQLVRRHALSCCLPPPYTAIACPSLPRPPPSVVLATCTHSHGLPPPTCMEEGHFGQACKHKGWSRLKLVFSAPLPTSNSSQSDSRSPMLRVGHHGPFGWRGAL
jgi:hypothetical protein